MANLNGQTIRGTNNYKGLLNLDSTIGTPLDATLRAVTDGAGTSSLLQLSTEAVGLSRTVNLSAGATTPRLFNVVYTINNSGVQTGTLTGIFLNANEALLNGITHNLMDLQVGGVSKFKVSNFGDLTVSRNINITTGTLYYVNAYASTGDFWMSASGTTNVLISNAANNNFGRLQLGGTTNAFPSIKRNGAAIDFRLADDSGFCDISAQRVFSNSQFQALSSNALIFGNVNNLYDMFFISGTNTQRVMTLNNNSAGIGTAAIAASAILQVDSTTKGFLMPRMTQAQILLIATPATGLQVFNTDLAQPCFYDGAGWRRISHSTM